MKYEIISDDILVDSRSTVDYNTFKRASDRLSHDMVTSDVDRIRSDYIVRQMFLKCLFNVSPDFNNLKLRRDLKLRGGR